MRYKLKSLDELLQQLIIKDPLPAISYPDAVQFSLVSMLELTCHRIIYCFGLH